MSTFWWYFSVLCQNTTLLNLKLLFTRRNLNRYTKALATLMKIQRFSLIAWELIKISISSFSIILRDIFDLHLFNGNGNRGRNSSKFPEGVHGQLEGCNRNLRPKTAVANYNHLALKFFGSQVHCKLLNSSTKSGKLLMQY